jgi:hypothetical protein
VGALSHYIGDAIGHSQATNLSVPVEFPKLGREYGPSVNYAQGERQDVRTEFAFDIHEIANHRVAPARYLSHIGLKVPTRQLALAFYQTYGLTIDFSGAGGRRINVSGYRFSVRTFIPRVAYAITVLHHQPEPVNTANPELEKEIATVAAQGDWDHYRRKAGIDTYSLAGIFLILPKIGPLKLIAVKGPTADTEAYYIHSVFNSTSALRSALALFTPPLTTRSNSAEAAAADTHSDPPPSRPLSAKTDAKQDIPRQSKDPRHLLPNRDLDTGNVVKPDGYSLTDSTYANLVHRLTMQPAQPIPPGIKEDIEIYMPIPIRLQPGRIPSFGRNCKLIS